MKANFACSDSAQSSGVPLPSSARTLRGHPFDPREDVWAWRDAVTRASIDFRSVKTLLSPEMLHSLKLVMLWMVENRATGGVHRDFHVLRTFFRFVRAPRRGPIVKIADTDILNYRASLSAHAPGRMIGKLRPIVRKWHSMGLPGVSREAITFLESLRIRNPMSGRAVRTHDPKWGPFTPIEFDALITKLNQSIAAGLIDEDYAVLTQILIALGIRTVQCALLKVCDITCESYDQRLRYVLRVPQVKQGHRQTREDFRECTLPGSLGKAVYEHAMRVRGRYTGILNDPGSAPLLPARRAKTLVPGYEYHSVSMDLEERFQAALARLEVYSERTGGLLYIAPIRFRRTFATRAAAEGWNPQAIAEALGHGNTRSVMVYIEAIPDITARIDRAIAAEMAPLAQAFAGTLIKNESEAIRGADPASRIFDARIDRSGTPLGSCGQFAFCGFSAPLTCYTCQHFQPWLDGPHEVVRDYLLERRAHLLATVTEQVAQINDRRILAVEQVIQLCRRAKAQPGEDHG